MKMNLLVFLFSIFFFLSNSCFAGNETLPLGLVQGSYVAATGSSGDCLEGELEVKKVDKDFSILIGNRVLVTNVKQGKISYFHDDGECEYRINGSGKIGELKATWTEKCKGQGPRWDDLDLTFKDGKLEYKKTWKETPAGVIKGQSTCQLKLAKDEGK
jgi:hypothetical protein